MDDKELIRLLRRDPQKGFDAMTAQYAGLLYAVARGTLPASRFSAAEVEEVVADTFSNFYLHLDDYKVELCSVKNYLCSAARNKATDTKRKARFVHLPLDDAQSMIEIPDKIEESELRADLMRGIKALGAPDSEIIIRKYYLGQSSKEIAAVLGMTVSNVDTRAHRAIEKLRKIFTEPSP